MRKRVFLIYGIPTEPGSIAYNLSRPFAVVFLGQIAHELRTGRSHNDANICGRVGCVSDFGWGREWGRFGLMLSTPESVGLAKRFHNQLVRSGWTHKGTRKGDD